MKRAQPSRHWKALWLGAEHPIFRVTVAISATSANRQSWCISSPFYSKRNTMSTGESIGRFVADISKGRKSGIYYQFSPSRRESARVMQSSAIMCKYGRNAFDSAVCLNNVFHSGLKHGCWSLVWTGARFAHRVDPWKREQKINFHCSTWLFSNCSLYKLTVTLKYPHYLSVPLLERKWFWLQDIPSSAKFMS